MMESEIFWNNVFGCVADPSIQSEHIWVYGRFKMKQLDIDVSPPANTSRLT